MRLWGRSGREGVEGAESDPASDAAEDLPAIPVQTTLETSAAETARGLWARAAAGATCDHPSVTPMMLSVAASELVTNGVSYWAWFEGRWWRTYATAGSQYGPVLDLQIPREVEYAQTPLGESNRLRSIRVPRRLLAAAWWDVGLGRRRPYSTSTAKANRGLEAAIAEEVAGPRGTLITYPYTSKTPVKILKGALAALKGGIRLVRSGLKGGDSSNAARDWSILRVGADLPASVVGLGRDLHDRQLQSWAIPAGLWQGATTAPREAWRFFLQGSVRPQMKLFADDLGRVLGVRVNLKWAALEAADLQIRTRALKNLVDAGIDVSEARYMVGLD